jgi:hypothetical protein
MQHYSESLDFWAQSPDQSYMHSMKSPFQRAGDAVQARDRWISQQLDFAQRSYAANLSGSWTSNYAQAFAYATHTMTDSTSPAHMENGVPITWPSNPRQHGDQSGSIETWADMSPALMRQNITAIQDAWRRVTGKNCDCRP